MRRRTHPALLLAGLLGLLLVAVGVIYLSVECQALPGLLGPTPGDTSPRTKLGVIGVVLGLAVLLATFLTAQHRLRRLNGGGEQQG